jgi:predicted ATPase
MAGLFHQFRREVQLARENAEAIIAFASERGFVRFVAGGIIRRGWALAEQGAAEEGIAQLRQGLATWRTQGAVLGLPLLLSRLAEAYGKGGRTAEGLHVIAEALAITHKNEERYYEAELYRLQGELLLQTDVRGLESGACSPPAGMHHAPLVEAETCFRRALDIACHRQTKSLELRAAMSLSRLWQHQGKRAEARQLLAEVYDWFTEGFETRDLQEAKALLEALR